MSHICFPLLILHRNKQTYFHCHLTPIGLVCRANAAWGTFIIYNSDYKSTSCYMTTPRTNDIIETTVWRLRFTKSNQALGIISVVSVTSFYQNEWFLDSGNSPSATRAATFLYQVWRAWNWLDLSNVPLWEALAFGFMLLGFHLFWVVFSSSRRGYCSSGAQEEWDRCKTRRVNDISLFRLNRRSNFPSKPKFSIEPVTMAHAHCTVLVVASCISRLGHCWFHVQYLRNF